MTYSEPGLRGGRCLCPTCGEKFNSAAAFDAHRTGKCDLSAPHYGRRCLTIVEMVGKGMTMNPKGFWLTPRKTPRRPSGIPAYAPTEQGPEVGRHRGSPPPLAPLPRSLAGIGRASA